MGRPAKILSKEDLLRAMSQTRSNRAAARYLHVSYKERLIFEAVIEEKCNKCGFAERRVLDNRVPLILHHKNKDKKDFTLDNIELLCYNCSFLYGVSPITDQQVVKMEDYVEKHGEEFTWEMDEHHIEHLRELGLMDEEQKPGEEYISKI